VSWNRYLHFAALGKRKKVGAKKRPKLTKARAKRLARLAVHIPRGAELR